jgi:hypothetical protein
LYLKLFLKALEQNDVLVMSRLLNDAERKRSVPNAYI